MSDCDCEVLRAELNCVRSDVQKIWDNTFGESERGFFLIGGTGVPTNEEEASNNTKWVQDRQDYAIASLLISSQNPDALFILGGGNFDWLPPTATPTYPFYQQEAKFLSGFGALHASRVLYPVMGDVDWFPTQVLPADFVPVAPGIGDEQEFNQTWLRSFPYLSDAKRYYSIYDDLSETEFFVLSSGRYADPSGVVLPGFWGPILLDPVVGEEQHDWFMARAGSSTAKNKVVLFHHTFVSIPTALDGTDGNGVSHLTNDFSDWDFESVGVRLIVNGHSGYSYHLRRGSLHIVNASAFVRSRVNAVYTGQVSPRPIPNTIGQTGWAVEYSSIYNQNLSNDPHPGVLIPTGPYLAEDYAYSRTEYIKLRAKRSGLIVEHWSYDLVPGTYDAAVLSKTLQHSFEVLSPS